MNDLGIDDDGIIAVEGTTSFSRAIRPMPFLCQATLILGPDDLAGVPNEQYQASIELIFREDIFDPVTRIRRGRLYKKQGSTQPCNWKNIEGISPSGQLTDRLLILYKNVPWSSLASPATNAKLALGNKNGYSIWDLILVERTTSRYELLTLRARSNLSLMPEASELSVSMDERAAVQTAIDRALDTQQKLDADATIDACRHAAVTALRAWLGKDVAGLDLVELADRLTKAKKMPVVVVNVARTIARLHTRTKPNVREKHSARLNEQDDGDAAVSMLSLLLRELRTSPPALN